MNKQRRMRIAAVIQQLEEMREEIESIKDEEQDAFDNYPESLQSSARGEAMEEAISNLEYAYDSIDEIMTYLDEAGQ